MLIRNNKTKEEINVPTQKGLYMIQSGEYTQVFRAVEKKVKEVKAEKKAPKKKKENKRK